MQDVFKQALVQSQAGMRMIAQLTLYNRGDFQRLREFVAASYHPTLLEEHGAPARVAVLKAQYRLLGRLRIRQVIATDKHEAIVLLNAEKNDRLYLLDVGVEADYPHRILRFAQQTLN
ncbi:MAG: hypothetical protein DIU68_003935 [Chloroflexota bacterium]|nr:MAG: hypothetical protein DIU68_20665 [Chloroflexota bacterium]